MGSKGLQLIELEFGQGLTGEESSDVQPPDFVVLGDDRRGLGIDFGKGIAEGFLLRRALSPLGPALIVGQALDDLLHLVPRLVPVKVRLAAQRLFDGQHGIEQFGANIEVAFLGFLGDLEPQAQRTQDGDAPVAEIGIVKNLAGVGLIRAIHGAHPFGATFGRPNRRSCRFVGHRAVLAGDLGNGGLVQIAAFVAEAALHRRPALAGVDQLNLALAVRLLAVAEHPDEGADAGVVEHLLGQGDDGFQPVVFDDPAADFAFAAARAAGEQRRAVENDGDARAGFVAVALLPRLELGDHVDQKQQRAVVDARQLAAVAAKVGPAVDLLLLPFPVHAKGRVGQQVVEAHAIKLVVGQGVAVFDAAVAVPLDQQIGGGHGVGARVVVLAVDLDRGLFVVGSNPVLAFSLPWVSDKSFDGRGNYTTGIKEQIIFS